MSQSLKWVKTACRSNRVWRTFWQAFLAFLTVHLTTFFDGSGDIRLAAQALITGALAAGISAVWKTTESDLEASRKKGAA